MNGHTAGKWEMQRLHSHNEAIVGIWAIPGGECIAVCKSGSADNEANAVFIVRACNSHAGLLAEHKAWARDFGAALLLYLQGDHTAIDSLAHDLIIDQDKDGPVLHSHAIAKAEGRG